MSRIRYGCITTVLYVFKCYIWGRSISPNAGFVKSVHTEVTVDILWAWTSAYISHVWWHLSLEMFGRCVAATQLKVNFLWKTLWEKQAGTIYTATHMSRHLSKQKVLNPALACWSVPDNWLITVRPLQQRKTADEKSESLQARPVPTATCVLTCKILSPYVPPTSPPPPPPPSPALGPFVQTR